MADVHSDKLIKEYNGFAGARAQTWQMLKGAAAVTGGNWIPNQLNKAGTIELTGNLQGTVQVFGTNADDPEDPGDTSEVLGTQIGTDITYAGANQFVYLDHPYRYVRVAISAHTSGSLDARLHAVSGT